VIKVFALLLLFSFTESVFSHVKDGLGTTRVQRQETNQEDLKSLRKIGDHLNLFYIHTDWWKHRLSAMEGIDSSRLTFGDRVSLKRIIEHEPNEQVKAAATVALSGGQTVSMRLREQKKILANLGDKKSLGYKSGDPAAKRAEALANLKLPLSQTAKDELEEVRRGDPDLDVKEEATKILSGGLPSNLKMPEDPKVLEKIGSHKDFNYDPKKSWTERANALKEIRLDDVTILNEKNLERIAKEDPHPEVRRAAENMHKGYLARESQDIEEGVLKD